MTQPADTVAGRIAGERDNLSELIAATHAPWTAELALALDEASERIARLAEIVHYHVQCDEHLNPPTQG